MGPGATPAQARARRGEPPTPVGPPRSARASLSRRPSAADTSARRSRPCGKIPRENAAEHPGASRWPRHPPAGSLPRLLARGERAFGVFGIAAMLTAPVKFSAGEGSQEASAASGAPGRFLSPVKKSRAKPGKSTAARSSNSERPSREYDCAKLAKTPLARREKLA